MCRYVGQLVWRVNWFFSLWPTFDRKSDLVEALIRANSDDGEAVKRIRAQDMLIVGGQEANWICIDAEGLVFRIDTMSSPFAVPVAIAANFETFLLLAGNLHEISEQYEGDCIGCARKMRACCVSFLCDSSQIEFWEEMAKEMA